MYKIQLIKDNIIDIVGIDSNSTVTSFKVVGQEGLTEIKFLPSGIKVNIKFIDKTKGYAITPIDWLQNTVYGERIY